MKAVICGHGPSLLAEEMGPIIDGYDKVIRIFKPNTLDVMEKLPQHTGRKLDVICSSYYRGIQVLKVKAPEYWMFLDSRNAQTPQGEIDQVPDLFPKDSTVFVDKDLCNFWDERYREIRDTMGPYTKWDERQKVNHPLGHNHMSAGLHCLIYALAKGYDVTLAGFDNVAMGEFCWSFTRGANWKNYPDHRWDVEHDMIDILKDYYDKKIDFLIPDEMLNEPIPHTG